MCRRLLRARSLTGGIGLTWANAASVSSKRPSATSAAALDASAAPSRRACWAQGPRRPLRETPAPGREPPGRRLTHTAPEPYGDDRVRLVWRAAPSRGLRPACARHTSAAHQARQHGERLHGLRSTGGNRLGEVRLRLSPLLVLGCEQRFLQRQHPVPARTLCRRGSTRRSGPCHLAGPVLRRAGSLRNAVPVQVGQPSKMLVASRMTREASGPEFCPSGCRARGSSPRSCRARGSRCRRRSCRRPPCTSYLSSPRSPSNSTGPGLRQVRRRLDQRRRAEGRRRHDLRLPQLRAGPLRAVGRAGTAAPRGVANARRLSTTSAKRSPWSQADSACSWRTSRRAFSDVRRPRQTERAGKV